MNWERDLYPIVIVQTRYGGTYEGGKWAAFCCDEYDTWSYDGPFADDVTCALWWAENWHLVGVGEDPIKARDDLIRKRWLEPR